jgi:hypothetical protein
VDDADHEGTPKSRLAFPPSGRRRFAFVEPAAVCQRFRDLPRITIAPIADWLFEGRNQYANALWPEYGRPGNPQGNAATLSSRSRELSFCREPTTCCSSCTTLHHYILSKLEIPIKI